MLRLFVHLQDVSNQCSTLLCAAPPRQQEIIYKWTPKPRPQFIRVDVKTKLHTLIRKVRRGFAERPFSQYQRYFIQWQCHNMLIEPYYSSIYDGGGGGHAETCNFTNSHSLFIKCITEQDSEMKSNVFN